MNCECEQFTLILLKCLKVVLLVRVKLSLDVISLEMCLTTALAGWKEILIRGLLAYKDFFFKHQDSNQSTLVRPIKQHSNSLRKMLKALSLNSLLNQ